MKITVNEALRLRNELKNNLQNEYNKVRNGSYCGIKIQDGEDITDYNKDSIVIVMDRINKLTRYLVELETSITEFNVSSGITTFVLLVKYLEKVISNYEIVIQQSTPYKRKETPLMRESKEVTIEYNPVYTKTSLKETIKELKKSVREAQSKIFKLNNAEIETSFEYEDIL